MTYIAGATHREPAGIDLKENAAAILFLFLTVAVCALRLFVPPNLMNLMMPYTEEGGSFYEKIHIGTYALGVLTFAILSTRRLVLFGPDIALFRSMVRFAVILAAFAAYLAFMKRFNAIGFLVETYLSAVLTAILLLAQSPQARRIVATTILSILLASAVIAISEALLGFRLMPIVGADTAYRSTGLTNHPLVLGAQCVIAIGFVLLTRWPVWSKNLAILILLVGCASANARAALAACILEILLLILFVRWRSLPPRRELQAKLVALFAVILLGALLLIALLSLGFLSRFDSVVDNSSMARIQIYEVFRYISWKDLFLGMNSTDLLRVVNEKVGLPAIESVPVFFVTLMGLPMAIAFTIVVVGYVLRLLHGTPVAAKIGVTLLFVVDLTNNALATKSTNILILSALLIGLGARGIVTSETSTGSVPQR